MDLLDLDRHWLRSQQLSLLARWPQLPGILSRSMRGFRKTHNHQVEYAVKAVENGGTSIGIRCKDGVVLALEKLIPSKLLKKDANKRIATVDSNIGIVWLSIDLSWRRVSNLISTGIIRSTTRWTTLCFSRS